MDVQKKEKRKGKFLCSLGLLKARTLTGHTLEVGPYESAGSWPLLPEGKLSVPMKVSVIIWYQSHPDFEKPRGSSAPFLLTPPHSQTWLE